MVWSMLELLLLRGFSSSSALVSRMGRGTRARALVMFSKHTEFHAIRTLPTHMLRDQSRRSSPLIVP